MLQLLQGGLFPKHLDGAIDSPVAALATIRTLLFMAGISGDVVSSIDVSTAFLQGEEYGPDSPPRYVSYRPHKGAEVEYAILRGPI